MELEKTNNIYYQITITCGLCMEKIIIHNNIKDIEDELRNMKKLVGKEKWAEYVKQCVKVKKIEELKIINLGKNL